MTTLQKYAKVRKFALPRQMNNLMTSVSKASPNMLVEESARPGRALADRRGQPWGCESCVLLAHFGYSVEMLL